MKRARSVDLREQALGALADGLSRREVCQAFGIHRPSVLRWHQRAAAGSLESRHGGGNPRKIKPEHEAALLHQLQASPDATLEDWRSTRPVGGKSRGNP